MASGCAYDCVHPWWGGSGHCIVADTGDPECVCDADYESRDARGNASCVPRRVLVAAYLALSTASVAAAAITVRNISQYRHLPMRVQSARKTSIRMRALVSTSLYVIGFGVIGSALSVRAGGTAYTDTGVTQIIYTFLLPSMVFGIVMMGEYWVGCLPSQVISPGSFAATLRNSSETGNAFVLVGLAYGSPISVLGVLTLIFEDWPQRIADVVVAVVTMGVILFVAVQTTGLINQALAKGSATSKVFYVTARKRLWRQASTLCGIACGLIAMTFIKRVTTIGRYTPSIVSTAQILCAHAAAAVFASATRFEAPPPASQSEVVAASPRGSTASVPLDVSLAMHAFVLAQRRRLAALALRSHEEDEPTWSGMQHSHTNEAKVMVPFEVVVKPTLGGRDEIQRHSRKGYASRVVPINEGRASCHTLDDRDGTCCSTQEELEVYSVDDTKWQEMPS